MEKDTVSKLRRLIVARIIFACLLLISTSLSFKNSSLDPFEPPLLWIYGLISSLILLSLVYYAYMRIAPVAWVGAFVQVCLDSVAVTAIVYLTGGVGSVFTFLYLIVIIYAGIILYRHGSLAITLCCGVQYASLIGLQYFDFISPRLGIVSITIGSYGSIQTLYKVAVTLLAFLAVALLSSFLAEQNRKSKSKLNVMAERVRRVEKLAAMGEMAAGLAHEIKNPLAAMTGSIQLLQEELPADPGRDQLMGIVMREADRLTSLINDFLLFARPPTCRVEVIELKPVITHTIELFANDGRFATHIDIRTRLLPDVAVRMDAALLRQVFWNLLLNAAEAIEGKGEITITMEQALADWVTIDIRDTGCGIPPEHIEAIFDPFFTTKPKGTGLGLSIVHSILESSDGRLEVSSQHGQGTCFRLIMPALSIETSRSKAMN